MKNPKRQNRKRRADDEMSTTGAMTSVLAPEKSIRPTARPSKKFASGGMVKGCKPGQESGKKFSGTF